MAARRRNLQRALGLLLTANVGHIHGVLGIGEPALAQRCGVRVHRRVAPNVIDKLPQGRGAKHTDALDQRRLVGVRRWHHHGLHPPRPGESDHRQYAVGMAQLALEGELAYQGGVGEARLDLPAAAENPYGDGQVVRRPLLAQVGRSKAHRNAAQGKLVARVADRRPHPFLRFLHRRVRQPHHNERRQARRHVHLDLDDFAVEPYERTRSGLR